MPSPGTDKSTVARADMLCKVGSAELSLKCAGRIMMCRSAVSAHISPCEGLERGSGIQKFCVCWYPVGESHRAIKPIGVLCCLFSAVVPSRHCTADTSRQGRGHLVPPTVAVERRRKVGYSKCEIHGK